MKKTVLGLFKKNNVDNENTKPDLSVSDIIKATNKKLQESGLDKKKNVPFFITSKGEQIDLRTKQSVNNEKETTVPKSEYDFKITLSHIALKAHYEGKNISESNAREFLSGTEFISGKKLSQLYAFYNNSTDRCADPQSKTKLKNKIELFKEVTTLLPDNKRGKAIDETKVLESFIPLY